MEACHGIILKNFEFLCRLGSTFGSATFLAPSCSTASLLRHIFLSVNNLFNILIGFLKGLLVLFLFCSLFHYIASACGAELRFGPFLRLDVDLGLTTKGCHRSIEYVIQIGQRVEISCLSSWGNCWVHMSINLSFVDLDLLHPVVTLGALRTMLLPCIGLGYLATILRENSIQSVLAFPSRLSSLFVKTAVLDPIVNIAKLVIRLTCEFALLSQIGRTWFSKRHLTVEGAGTHHMLMDLFAYISCTTVWAQRTFS